MALQSQLLKSKEKKNKARTEKGRVLHQISQFRNLSAEPIILVYTVEKIIHCSMFLSYGKIRQLATEYSSSIPYAWELAARYMNAVLEPKKS